MNGFDRRLAESGNGTLCCQRIQTVQINLGLRCNMRCAHCHVQASPERTEVMSWPTMQRILDMLARMRKPRIDITGGAPELNPHLRPFIVALCEQQHAVQLRTNLTVLLEPGQRDLPEFFRQHHVALVASMPCYLEDNVDAQRGDGAYTISIESLRHLNAIGYGIDETLPLDLVFTPGGAALPPSQTDLEHAYKKELNDRFGIRFTRLLTLTNAPIGRFLKSLQRQNRARGYENLLCDSFNAANVDGLMCRSQISIGWDGTLYDCDFNLALGLPVDHGAPDHINVFDLDALEQRRIVTGDHCFACTAGAGSSCGGALT